MSDSDPRDPNRAWPAVERRTADRRHAGAATRRTSRAKDDGEIRTPGRGGAERRTGHNRRDDSAWESVPLELASATDAEQALVLAATDARTRAQARYSGFLVGAALETHDGVVVTGCNIENATYGLTLCAERVALVKALSEGHLTFTRIAVVADTESPTPPCGPCRQLLWEYCGEIEVILANLERTTARLRLSELLPMPFDGRLLE